MALKILKDIFPSSLTHSRKKKLVSIRIVHIVSGLESESQKALHMLASTVLRKAPPSGIERDHVSSKQKEALGPPTLYKNEEG